MPVARDPCILPESRPEPEALNVKTPGQPVVGHKVRQLVAGKFCAEPAVLQVLLRQALQELALTGLGRTPGAIVPEVVAFPAPVAAGTDLVGRCHSTHAPSQTLSLPGLLSAVCPSFTRNQIGSTPRFLQSRCSPRKSSATEAQPSISLQQDPTAGPWPQGGL